MSLSQALNQFAQNLGRYLRLFAIICICAIIFYERNRAKEIRDPDETKSHIRATFQNSKPLEQRLIMVISRMRGIGDLEFIILRNS